MTDYKSPSIEPSEESAITPEMLVSDLLTQYPTTAPIFIRYRMACVGCGMSSFETLAAAAEIYQVPLAQLINELESVIPK